MHCSKELGLSVPQRPCLCVPQGTMGTQMSRMWMAGAGGRSRIWGGGVNTMILVPSSPQRRSLTSCMEIRGQLEGSPIWTERSDLMSGRGPCLPPVTGGRHPGSSHLSRTRYLPHKAWLGPAPAVGARGARAKPRSLTSSHSFLH